MYICYHGTILLLVLPQDDTVKIIFSYHPDDPHGDDGVPYHGSNRGVKSLLLLSKLSLPTLESDAKHIDITNNVRLYILF